MPTKYYSIYNHRYVVTRNFTRKNKRRDPVAGLLPVVRDSRNVQQQQRVAVDVTPKKDDTVCDFLSGPSFRFVACLTLVMVVLLYKSVYVDYLHPKNGKSPKPLTARAAWNTSKTSRGDEEGKSKIEVIEILPNCGLQTICSDDAFPVHIYTGKNKTDFPKLCIMGKYVMSFNRSVGGRGINVALIEPTTYTTIAVKNFDTYEYNSSSLDEWLEHMIKVGDIVIIFTFDEASKKLTKNTKTVLYNLGSGKIQDLGYRCQWYMVTQKGIRGITPYEKITYSRKNNWADVLDDKLCVPFQITGNPIVSDSLTNNHPSFCNTTLLTADEYIEYCSESNKHTTRSVDYDYSKSQTSQNHRTTSNRLLDRTKLNIPVTIA